MLLSVIESYFVQIYRPKLERSLNIKQLPHGPRNTMGLVDLSPVVVSPVVCKPSCPGPVVTCPVSRIPRGGSMPTS